MRIGPYDELPGQHESLLGEESVLDAHAADLEIVLDLAVSGEVAHNPALLGRFDVFVWREVVRHEGDPPPVEDLRDTDLLEFFDRDGGRHIVAQNEVDLRLDELARFHGSQAGVVRKDLLSHRHWHWALLSVSAAAAPTAGPRSATPARAPSPITALIASR